MALLLVPSVLLVALNATRFAYAIVVYGPRAHLCHGLVTAASIRATDVHADVVLFTPEKALVAAFKALTPPPPGVSIRLVATPRTRGRWQWSLTFAKLWVGAWYEYDAVMVIDDDVLVLRSLRHLFEAAARVRPTIAAPRAYWLKQPFAQTGGPFLVTPSRHWFADKVRPVLTTPARSAYNGEMDWVNHQFKDDIVLLHGFYALLIAEWIHRDGVHGYWARRLNETAEGVLQQAYAVHFIATWKPWQHDYRAARGRDVAFDRVYDMWHALRRRVARYCL